MKKAELKNGVQYLGSNDGVEQIGRKDGYFKDETQLIKQALKTSLVGASIDDVQNIENPTTEAITDKEFKKFENIIKRYIKSKGKIDKDKTKDIDLELKVEEMLQKLSEINRSRIISEVIEETLKHF